MDEGDCVSKVSLLRYNQPSISLPLTWGTFRGNLAGLAVGWVEEDEEDEEEEEDEPKPKGVFWIRCLFRGGWLSAMLICSFWFLLFQCIWGPSQRQCPHILNVHSTSHHVVISGGSYR